jgi:hypothetical protein
VLWKRGAELLVRGAHREHSIQNKTVAISFDLFSRLLVKLVVNLADNLFEQIFQREDSLDAAVFVYDEEKVHSTCLHLPQRLPGRSYFGNERRLPEQSLETEVTRIRAAHVKILAIRHAAYVIDVRAVYRQS